MKVEFHCHTQFSRDSTLSLERLEREVVAKGIDVIVITDHGTIEGAKKAAAMWKQVQVIVGEESRQR